MEIPPDVTADNDDQNYVDVPMNDQEPDSIKEVEVDVERSVQYTVQQDLPEIQSIEASPLDDGILSMPRERNGIMKLIRDCLQHHSIFLAVVLCFYILFSIFSIATVPFYVTLLRIVCSVVGFVGIRLRKRPFILILFTGMLFQLAIITPIAALYSVIGIFFNDWGSTSKFFVIVLILFLFTSITCLEMCGFLKTVMLLRTRRKILREEKEEERRKNVEEISKRKDEEEGAEFEDPVVPLSMRGVDNNRKSGSFPPEERSHSLNRGGGMVYPGNIESQGDQQQQDDQTVLQSYGVQPVLPVSETY